METKRIGVNFPPNEPVDVIQEMDLTSQREAHNVYRDEFTGIIIDTCFTADTGHWETGVLTPEFPRWAIVSEYETEEEASVGHKGWVEALKKNPNMKLVSIN